MKQTNTTSNSVASELDTVEMLMAYGRWYEAETALRKHGGKMVVVSCFVAVFWHMLPDAQKWPLKRLKIYPYNLSG